MNLFRKNSRRDYSLHSPRIAKPLGTGEILVFLGTPDIGYTLLPGGIVQSELLPTGVTQGTYGSSTLIPVITVDINGRITAITEVPVAGGGSGVLLKTNGITNPVQTLLNLVAGTNMTITDDGLGNITFTSSGGSGGTYTADNGITPNTPVANNFQLGGPLVVNTTITAALFDFILTGTKPIRSRFVLDVQNTSTGSAIRAQANGGTGIGLNAISTDGDSVVATSDTGQAFNGFSTDGDAAYFESVNASAIIALGALKNVFTLTGGSGSTVDTILKLLKLNSINGSIGSGVAIEFWAGRNGSSASLLTGKIASVYEDVTNNLEDVSLDFSTTGKGIFTTNMILKGSGQLRLLKYGTGTPFTGTVVKSLGVDASGNVIEFTASPTTGDSISPFLLMGG